MILQKQNKRNNEIEITLKVSKKEINKEIETDKII